MTIELSQDRSDALVAANYEMLLALVELRRASGIRQEDVAAALGISQQAISQFERLERDPHLSTVAQYANAVGARVTHAVTPDTGTGTGTEAILADSRRVTHGSRSKHKSGAAPEGATPLKRAITT